MMMTSCEPAQEGVMLEYNLGEDFHRELEFAMDLKMDVPSPEASVMNMSMGFGFDVEGKSVENGLNIVDVTYTSIKMKSEMDTMKQEYNSETGVDNLGIGGAIFEALLNSTLTMDLSSAGKVSNVQGLDEVVDKMLVAMGSDTIAPEKAQMIKMQMKQQFNAEQIQGQLGLNNLNYPAHSVAVDSSWDFSTTQNASLPLVIEGAYTVVEVKENTVVLELNSEVKPEPSMAAMFMLNGTMTATVEVEKATGWPISLVGKMTAEGVSVQMPGEKITMEASYTLSSK